MAAEVLPPRPNRDPLEKCYEASVNGYTDVGGHVEYCVQLCHYSGVSWCLWRRFSEFSQLHEDLLSVVEKDELPAGRSWLPAFTQSLSADFCHQREAELRVYIQRLMAVPKILEASPLHDFLGIQCPEPPAGLRVVPRCHTLELEVSPPDVETFPATPRAGEHGGPVDGYWIEILNLQSGKKNRLKREVGASGRLLQTARVGRLEAGPHCFACAAFNAAGCSSPVSVTVDPAVVLASPPQLLEARGGRGYFMPEDRNEPPRPEVPRAHVRPWSGKAAGKGQALLQQQPLVQRSPGPGHGYVQSAWVTRQPVGQVAAKPAAKPEAQRRVQAPKPPLKDEEDEDLLCVVCLAAPKTHAFVPCGHRCVCASCAKEVFPDKGNCPVCRAEAQHVIQIFT